MIYTKDNDKNIYLEIGNNTYCYDPSSKPLGKGGFGIVYLGRNCATGEPVAIKKLHDEKAAIPHTRDCAKKEASFTFSHPHIIQMLGYCENEENSGPLYIVSRFVEGINIKKYVKTHFTVPDQRMEQICQMMYPIIEAVDELHASGYIHRDIKHLQMMASDKGAYLMDLGLVYDMDNNRMAVEPDNDYSIVGTILYQAPEQLFRSRFGKGHKEQHELRFMQLTPATDIYGLGLTLYELMADFLPFKSNNEAMLAGQILTRSIIPHRRIPHEVFKVLKKATSFDPKDRYQSCGELLSALKAAKKTFDLIDHLLLIPNAVRLRLALRRR